MSFLKNVMPWIFLLVSCAALGQVKNVFEEFDLTKGNWKLFGISNPEHISYKEDLWKLQDTLGDFYTNDLAVIQSIKTGLTPLKKEPRGYAFQFTLELYKDDTLKKSVWINIESNIVESKPRYAIDPGLMKNLVGKVKKIPKTEYTFSSLEEARNGYKVLSAIDSVLMTTPYDFYYGKEWSWLTYDGYMEIEVVDSAKTFKVYTKELEKRIKQNYPTEKFKIKSGGGHNGVGAPGGYPVNEFTIYCNEKLGKGYKGYRILTPWIRYNEIPIVVYGLTKEQIQKMLSKK